MKKLFLTITGLLFVAMTMTAQNKAGLLIGYNTASDIESASEKNAATWFQQNYADGVIFTPSTISTLSANDVKVLWVMVDRVGIEKGWQNLPAAFSDTQTVNALKSFVEAGGNLLLTNHATQLAVAVDRIAETYAPGIWGNGSGDPNPDVWGSQPIIGNVDGQIYDHSQHAIYQGMNFVSGLYERSIYPFIGSGVKLDHNCMWDLNAYGLPSNPNVVKAWEEMTNSTVLGTWNHVVDYCCAGIVDFEPTSTIQGRILAVGLAAYDWGMGSSNTYLDQLEKFTSNCLTYLGYEPGSGGGGNTGDHAAHFDMSLSGGKVKEEVSGSSFNVVSQLPATTIAGLYGEALRFDGYSNYVKASLPTGLNTETLTMSITLAAETYPMMQVDAAEEAPTYATVCGNLDETAKRGFSLQLSSQGDLRLKVAVNYSGGYIVTIDGNKKLPRGQWNRIDMVFDKGANKCELFLNGESIASKGVNRCNLLADGGDFYIGKDATEKKSGPFLLNTFCGAIDDITITNTASVPSAVTLTATPDFNYPAERYEGNLWRPQFHAMPSGSWTNESHGLTYNNGRWHLFFQKNANGPYMSRLHWGHISSENLYEWTEEPIALYPGESFDIKGCWSGCVYEEGGNHNLIYTAVDNGKARIAQAKSADNGLVSWGEKKVVIDGTPAGDFADFRDPYYFEANGNKYIIVGTGKNNIGCCTLHKLNGSSWTNDGTIFFQGTSQSQHGTFWEMPNLTPIGNGKWLFTCTPLGTGSGVRTLCWVGAISTDGKFVPDGGIAGMQLLEMNGISREGYGLLSPSIYTSADKTFLMGIVPDKLAATENYEIGWAHNFSLPREISLAADGSLVQKPYSGLTGLRTSTTVNIDQTLSGTLSLSPVSGRQIELLGEFTVGNGACGFHFLKKGDKQATLSYDPSTGILTLDYSTLDRVSNGKDTWSAKLPKKVSAGGTLKLDVFFDGSIADIFVNDTWAFCVRIFPTDADAVEAEVFSDTSAVVKVSAWTLNAQEGQGTGIDDAPLLNSETINNNKVYDLQGRRLNGIPQKGLYIKNGKKYVCR